MSKEMLNELVEATVTDVLFADQTGDAETWKEIKYRLAILGPIQAAYVVAESAIKLVHDEDALDALENLSSYLEIWGSSTHA